MSVARIFMTENSDDHDALIKAIKDIEYISKTVVTMDKSLQELIRAAENSKGFFAATLLFGAVIGGILTWITAKIDWIFK